MSPYSSSSSAAFSSSPAPNEYQSALARESHLARTGLAVGKGRVAPLQAAASLTSRPGTVLWTSSQPTEGKTPSSPALAQSIPLWGHEQAALRWAGEAALLGKPSGRGAAHGLVPTHGHRVSALPQQSPRSSTAALPVSSWKDL